MRRPAPALCATPVIVAVALSGCTTSSSSGVPTVPAAPAPGSAQTSQASAPLPSVTHTAGLPPHATPNAAFEAYALWADPGRMYVVTFGSSTCPKVPTGATVGAGNRLTDATKPTSDGPCTMDISPTTSLFDVPAALDDTKTVEVSIDGVMSMLPARWGMWQ